MVAIIGFTPSAQGCTNKEFEKVINDASTKFFCISCKSPPVSSADGSNLNNLNNDIVDIKRSLDNFLSQQAGILYKLELFNEDIKYLDKQNKDLKKTVADPNSRIKALENVRLRSQFSLSTILIRWTRTSQRIIC